MLFTSSLKKNYQFRFVYNKAKVMANKFLVMYIVKNNAKGNLLGISVSKKVGNSVTRSRVTRLIKESYRLKESSLKRGHSIVIIARNSASTASYQDIDKAMHNLFKRHSFYTKL